MKQDKNRVSTDDHIKHTSLLESNLIRATSPLFVAAYLSLFFTIELLLWNIVGGITIIGDCLGMACEKTIMKKLKEHSHQKMAARPTSEANGFPALRPTPGTTARSRLLMVLKLCFVRCFVLAF